MAGVFPHGFIGAMSCIEPPCLRTRCVSRKASGHSASESAACIIRSWTKSNETFQLRGSEMTDACSKKMLVGRSVLRENCVQETSTPYNVHWVFGGAVLATSIIQTPGEIFFSLSCMSNGVNNTTSYRFRNPNPVWMHPAEGAQTHRIWVDDLECDQRSNDVVNWVYVKENKLSLHRTSEISISVHLCHSSLGLSLLSI